jgi:hypothetical protein
MIDHHGHLWLWKDTRDALSGNRLIRTEKINLKDAKLIVRLAEFQEYPMKDEDGCWLGQAGVDETFDIREVEEAIAMNQPLHLIHDYDWKKAQRDQNILFDQYPLYGSKKSK